MFASFSIVGSMFVREVESFPLFTSFLKYTVSFENRFYDFRMKNQLDPRIKSENIRLVEIDDYSLEKIGTWPIPRIQHAKMLDKLRMYGAKVVALDILYPEKSPDYGGIPQDQVFIEAIQNFQKEGRRVFISYTNASNGEEELQETPLEMLDDAIQTKNKADFTPQKLSPYTFPIDEILKSGVGLGNITSSEDADGIFRNYQIAHNIDSIYYGSLGLNAFEAYTGRKHEIIISKDSTGELFLDGKKMEIYPNGEIKIRYIGASNTFPSISLSDLLNAADDDPQMKELINGKLLFVGSTALGAHDLRPSPLDAKMPGVYSHINVAYMLLNKYFYQNTNESVKYSFFLLLIGMTIFLLFQKIGHAILDTAVITLLIGGSFYADKYIFLPKGYELKLFYCYFCFISCYSWNTFIKLYESNKEKKQIRGTFARYVAPTVVDEMLKDPDNIHVGGTKMDITCLFSDVRDFTRISEGLSATELAHSLNLYMGEMTDIVFDTKGTLDKYIGDAIVAIWGAPLPIGNHAQHAVEAAIKMINTLPSINDEFEKLKRPRFNVGIGLNSGECSVGNMGSSRIFSYTALGDNMNLGARLESLCKYYGAQILISDMTLERLDLTHIKTRLLDKVVVKGKTSAVGVHEVLHSQHWMTKDPEFLNSYLKGYQLFQEQNFQEALNIFNQILLANLEDKPSKRLSELCKKYLQEPQLLTETFDVTVMTEK